MMTIEQKPVADPKKKNLTKIVLQMVVGGAIGFFSMLALDRLFDVLRIAIHAADDDQILEASRDEQLARVQESQVAGPQKAALGEQLLVLVGLGIG